MIALLFLKIRFLISLHKFSNIFQNIALAQAAN